MSPACATVLLAQRLGQWNAGGDNGGDDHADDTLEWEAHEQQAHNHNRLAHNGAHRRCRADGDAKDRIGASEDGKAIAQAYAREDNREEVAAAPAHVDEGGCQHGLEKTGRDDHTGGDGEVGLHKYVGLGLTGKHGIRQNCAADGERQASQHGLDDGALPYCMGQRLTCMLGDKVQPTAYGADQRQRNEPDKFQVAHLGSLEPRHAHAATHKLAEQQIGAQAAGNRDAVDHGLLRKNEGDEVEGVFGPNGQFDLNFIRVNAQERYYSKLAGVTEPEAKRKIIGEEFIRVFEAEAKKIGKVDYLVQGTIYPDVIESGAGDAAVIKSHHNVGGLPEHVDFKEIVEPLRDLFKDEVRQLGIELGLPEKFVWRQPFPGPGLAVRVIGEITEDKLEILRDADAIFREEIANAGLERDINQYFAVITDMRSVGVMGDGRTYDYTLALRAVTTTDFMTADWARIPFDVLEKVSNRIVNEVKHVNRLVYDITSKPPATIEWE